jgi:hypothetical protein
MAVRENLIQAFMRITQLDQVLRKEIAQRAQIGGIMTDFSPTDDIVGELAVVEEALSQFNLITRMHRERRMRYRDYDAMDNYGDVSVALDIYAEEASQNDLIKQNNLWITGDPNIVEILEQLFNRLKLRTMLFGFARQLAKYGDLFITPKYDINGISDIIYVPPEHIERVGLGVEKVKHYKLEHQLKILSPRKDGLLLPWECVHFRLLSFGFSTVYGRSIIEAARKRWLHLKLLEDAIAIYRLNRAVERLIFYIDVGAASPSEALRIVNQYKRRFGNKRSYIDPSTGTFEQQYDPANMLENYFWPVNSSTERSRIEKLAPPPDQGQLQDLEHFNQKLYVALGIPKDFLTGESTGNWNSRESLALQDIRFSRKLHRLQLGLLEGIRQLCIFHLTIVLKDANAAMGANFELHMADVSKIARQQYDQILLNRIQVLTMLNDLGNNMGLNRDVFLPWVLENYFPDMPKEMIMQVLIPDQLMAQASSQIAIANNPPPAAPAQPAAKAKAKKKPGKKKKANEEIVQMIMRDLKEDPRFKDNLSDAVGRITSTTTPVKPLVENRFISKKDLETFKETTLKMVDLTEDL